MTHSAMIEAAPRIPTGAGYANAGVPFAQVLWALCQQVLADAARPGTRISFDMAVQDDCPADLRAPLLRVVDELLTNAVEHGFYGRLRGQLSLRVRAVGVRAIEVASFDDGWGFEAQGVADGNGFALVRQLGRLDPAAGGGPAGARTGVSVRLRAEGSRCAPRPRPAPPPIGAG